jgi:hypothetical protein
MLRYDVFVQHHDLGEDFHACVNLPEKPRHDRDDRTAHQRYVVTNVIAPVLRLHNLPHFEHHTVHSERRNNLLGSDHECLEYAVSGEVAGPARGHVPAPACFLRLHVRSTSSLPGLRVPAEAGLLFDSAFCQALSSQ